MSINLKVKYKVPMKQFCVTCLQDEGDKATICQWCSMWEHRICASVSAEYYQYSYTDSSCSMTVNIVRELEDKEYHKNNLIFYNVLENITPSCRTESAYISDLCRNTFDLNVKIIKLFRIGRK